MKDDEIQSIISNVSENDYTNLYSVDWANVSKPKQEDYNNSQEYGKAFAEAWL